MEVRSDQNANWKVESYLNLMSWEMDEFRKLAYAESKQMNAEYIFKNKNDPVLLSFPAEEGWDKLRMGVIVSESPLPSSWVATIAHLQAIVATHLPA